MASFKTIHLFQARLRADVSEIASISKQFVDFIGGLGLAEQEVDGWKLVFAEMLANAIKHGAKYATGEALRISWWVEGNVFYLETRDPGPGPDDSLIQNPSLPEDPLSEGGRGLFIIRSFVENWRHSRSSDVYILRVWKSYPALAEVAPEDPAMELILDELADSYENLALYDRLGQAVVGGDSFADFFRSTLQVFIDAGTPDYFHIEALPDSDLPELDALKHQPEFKRFGSALPSLWQQLENKPYALWTRNNADLPFDVDPSAMPCREGCVIPISHNEHVVALLALGYDSNKDSIGSRVVRQIQALGSILSMALSRSIMDRERADRDRIRHAFQIATELQQQLLPLNALPPSSDGWQFFVSCDPALEVAGDFAEIRPSCNNTVVGCIIDVMGKGVTAAILAGIFRSHFIDFSRGTEAPADFSARVNNALEIQLAAQTMFITGVIFRLDLLSGRLQLVIAGHPPVVLLKKSGETLEFAANNPPLGLFIDQSFASIDLEIVVGDRCFFVTDGFYEWQTEEGRLFDWGPFVEWLKTQFNYPGEKIIQHFHQLSRSSAESRSTKLSRDDETLMVLTRTD